MTAAELIEVLKGFPADMDVRYEYDSGFSYPTFKKVEIHAATSEISEPFVCLYEDDELA
jgi:hypothetical protein